MYGEADDIAAADIRKEREADWHLTYRTYMAKRYNTALFTAMRRDNLLIHLFPIHYYPLQNTVHVSDSKGSKKSRTKNLENSAKNGQNSDKNAPKMRSFHRKVFHGL